MTDYERDTAEVAPSVDQGEAPHARLLEVGKLCVEFQLPTGVGRAVDEISLSLDGGETLAVVGESGAGKSVAMLAIMGLLSHRTTTLSGHARLRGQDLIGMTQRQLRRVRGNDIAMIFQDPIASLNPVHSVGDQIIEAVKLHNSVSKREATRRARDALGEVGISRPDRRMNDYPHQFSGGMRQRVMIAMALINNPGVLIADEPTTALDVTTQAQILELIAALQRDHGTAVILITHDLGVVAEVADRVMVMYGGRIAEEASVGEIFHEPRHPYTWGLLRSIPTLEGDVARLIPIPGQPPSLTDPPNGCRFHLRCGHAMPICRAVEPRLTASGRESSDHRDSCHLDEAIKRQEAQRWRL